MDRNMEVSERHWLARGLICGFLILVSFNLTALILTGEGNGPVRDNAWPEGALAVANLSTRSSWWEGPPFGGGEHHFDYRGNTEQFREALEAFSKIVAPRLELVIHGESYSGFPTSRRDGANAPPPIDWSFTIWNPERWNLLYNNPKSFFGSDQPNFRQPVAPPRIDVYPGFGVRWDQVKVPTNVTVLDRRLASIGMPSGSGTVIRAEVFDIATGKPVKGARLDVSKPNEKGEYESFAGQETDARGHVELTKVPGANLRLSVSAPDYAPKEMGYQSGGSNTLVNLVVELSKSSSITGRVIDTSGEPVNGAKLSPANTLGIDGRGYAAPARVETVTDQDGRFEFKNLPHGFTGIWMMDPRFHYSGINDLYPVGGPGA